MSSSNKPIRVKPVFKKFQVDDRYKFKPLPAPSGLYPFHLNLDQIITPAGNQSMVFHMVGDTGSVRLPEFQHLVARDMIKQIQEAGDSQHKPQFLYHLGDIVYKFGEADGYYTQFFKPYRDYPCPVFAIAGNHDSDINPDSTNSYNSLDAFTSVFCDDSSKTLLLAEDTGRKSMVQPNIYWTLQTPLANIIGLYSNVPKYGVITDEQKTWFISELKVAALEKADKVLIVCVHHAPFSADINHSSSLSMIQFLESAYEKANVRPDIVFSGHVHNYQRFSKQYPGETTIPYIVAGAGGYDELHPIAAIDDTGYSDQHKLFDNVSLDSYCADKHGFLKVTIEKTTVGLLLTGEYYTIPHTMLTDSSIPAILFDRFTLELPRQRM